MRTIISWFSPLLRRFGSVSRQDRISFSLHYKGFDYELHTLRVARQPDITEFLQYGGSSSCPALYNNRSKRVFDDDWAIKVLRTNTNFNSHGFRTFQNSTFSNCGFLLLCASLFSLLIFCVIFWKGLIGLNSCLFSLFFFLTELWFLFILVC